MGIVKCSHTTVLQVLSFKELQAQFRADFAAKSGAVKEGGREMARSMADTLAMLGMLGRASPGWTAWTGHIADIIVAGLRNCALVSLRYLLALVGPMRLTYCYLVVAKWYSAEEQMQSALGVWYIVLCGTENILRCGPCDILTNL